MMPKAFEKRLAERAVEIDAALDAALGSGRATPERLAAAMRHAVMAGGKRIRPFLVIETAAALGARPAAAMPAAVALELVHCYSLVHDDLPAMDNDALRRGQPTVWKAFDDWTAILAGDALLTLAFEHLASGAAGGLPPSHQLELVRLLAVAAGPCGMVGGQCLDLEADKLGTPARPEVRHIETLQALKTGALFRFACEAGAIVAGSGPAERTALRQFGKKLGAAFQLADDLLDVEGEAATVGKATGKDAAAGKATLVGALGLETARARLTEIERAGLAEIANLGQAGDVLRQTLHFAVARRS
jgi:farnesyl diphosphate synthase